MVDATTLRNSLLRDSSSATGTPAAATSALQQKNGAIGQSEFLNLLVTQLKNQDPMEPMKNDEFAVNLAQFSQLEQLISINDKVGNQGADLGTLSAYLGHEVTMNSDQVAVSNHNGGLVKFDLGQDAASVKVNLIDPVTGAVQESIDYGPMSAGKQTVELSNLTTSGGNYRIQVDVVGAVGGQFQVEAKSAAVVTGFVPGPQPKLLTEFGEIDPGDIIAVNVAR